MDIKKTFTTIACSCALLPCVAVCSFDVGPEAFDPKGGHIQGVAAGEDAERSGAACGVRLWARDKVWLPEHCKCRWNPLRIVLCSRGLAVNSAFRQVAECSRDAGRGPEPGVRRSARLLAHARGAFCSGDHKAIQVAAVGVLRFRFLRFQVIRPAAFSRKF